MHCQKKGSSQFGLGVLFTYFSLISTTMGATFNVDSFIDQPDISPGDGFCVSIVGGLCTLRAAIQETSALSSHDVINLAAGTYTLTLTGSNEDDGITGDLDITGGGDLIIQGDSKDTTFISGNKTRGTRDRIFHILATAGNVTFNNFTAGNTWAYFQNGAGIYNSGPNTILNEIEISDNYAVPNLNRAVSPPRSEYGVGGGIYNDLNASLILDRSSVIYNASGNTDFWDAASRTFSGGGGVRNLGYLEVRNQSHIDYNRAKLGGGINNTGVTDIIDSTVLGNNAFGTGSGGGISNREGVLSIRRSYIGDNTCQFCDGGGIANQESGPSPAVIIILESAIDNNQTVLGIGGGISNFSNMYIGFSSISWNSSPGLGGGLSNSGLAALTIENTSIIGNSAAVLGAYGAGIHTTAAMTLNQVTLTGNFAHSEFAEDLYIDTQEFDANDPADWVTIKNSIIGDDAYRRKLFQSPAAIENFNTFPDNFCGGGFSTGTGIGGENFSTTDYLSLIKSQGYNIANGSTCALNGTGDQINTAPVLLDAGAYGGATLPPGPYLPNPVTRPLAPTSPARDAIPVSSCSIRFDQKTRDRPSGSACDVGAVEEGATTSTYADLELRAILVPTSPARGGAPGSGKATTAKSGNFIAPDQSILYTLSVKNHGPSDSDELTGGVLTNIKLEGMSLIHSSFTAPNGLGEVTCTQRAVNNRENNVDCNFDTPLAANTELLIYLTLSPSGSNTKRSASAQVKAGRTPDIFVQNNSKSATLFFSADSPVEPEPAPAQPANENPQNGGGGIMNLFELFFFSALAIVFTLFRSMTRKNKVFAGSLFLFFSTSHAAVPTITNITPNTGSATSATVVTITGTGFDSNITVGLLNDPAVSSVVARVGSENAFYAAAKNNLLYVARDTGGSTLEVYDVTDPSAPILQVSNMRALKLRTPGGIGGTTSSRLNGFAIRSDNTVFIPLSGLGSPAMVAYDFNTPTTPTLLQVFPFFTRADGLHPRTDTIKSIDVDDDILYMSKGQGGSISLFNQTGIFIIDTSKVNGANILSFIPLLNPSGSRRIKVVSVPTSEGIRKFLLTAGGPTTVNIAGVPTQGELIIFEVTDPENPIAVYAVNGPSTVGHRDRIEDVDVWLDTVGSITKVYAIVASRNTTSFGPAGLYIYDVGPDTGFSNLDPIGSYGNLEDFSRISIEGHIATALDLPTGPYHYYDFDLRDPTAPKLVGGPYSTGTEIASYYPWNSTTDNGHIYASGGFIYKRNPPITVSNVTATTITATIPAGYIPQQYDLVVTNSLGETEEVILPDAFTIP